MTMTKRQARLQRQKLTALFCLSTLLGMVVAGQSQLAEASEEPICPLAGGCSEEELRQAGSSLPTNSKMLREDEVSVGEAPSVSSIIMAVFGPQTWSEAMRVAFCESSLNPQTSHRLSSAKGLFQIIDSTWEGYNCKGDPFNPLANSICAKKIYDKNGWNSTASWGASYACHGKD